MFKNKKKEKKRTEHKYTAYFAFQIAETVWNPKYAVYGVTRFLWWECTNTTLNIVDRDTTGSRAVAAENPWYTAKGRLFTAINCRKQCPKTLAGNEQVAVSWQHPHMRQEAEKCVSPVSPTLQPKSHNPPPKLNARKLCRPFFNLMLFNKECSGLPLPWQQKVVPSLILVLMGFFKAH